MITFEVFRHCKTPGLIDYLGTVKASDISEAERKAAAMFDCPEGEELMIEEPLYEQCYTCNGSGIVNPLTAPKGFLCLSATTCPDCEGAGRI